MSLEILQLSVVVLASSHNPTILHPHFLKSNRIVPDEWEPEDEQTLSTPPFARVVFTNGFLFLAQLDKIQIQDNHPPPNCVESPVAEVAAKYVKALPHVRYRAVGININGIIEIAEAERVLADRFLKGDQLSQIGEGPFDASLNLKYSFDSGDLNLTVGSGTAQSREIHKKGVILKANYNTPISEGEPSESLDAVLAGIQSFAEKCADIQRIASLLFATEGEG